VITDLEGNSRTLSLQDFTTLMLSYGQARVQLSSQYATRLGMINEANSLEELNAI
jgi:hypothetical protein